MKTINSPLFIKINEEKFVKVHYQGVVLTDDDLKKYQERGVAFLYVRNSDSKNFMSLYQKNVLADSAWSEMSGEQFDEGIRLNSELLRQTGLKVSEELVEMTKSHVQLALRIISKNKQLSGILPRFQKTESQEYCDHCVLIIHIGAYILSKLNPSGMTHNMRVMTLAALLHDASLDDYLYQLKVKLLNTGQLHDLDSGLPEEQEIFQHPIAGADFSHEFDFCHPEVETVISQHHENTSGTGFPKGLKKEEIHPLSGLFIVAEDFTHYFLEHYPKPDWKKYIRERRSIFADQPFKDAFQIFAKGLVEIQ
jgi:hypothetical protein